MTVRPEDDDAAGKDDAPTRLSKASSFVNERSQPE